jgi:hypothetical protein
VDPAIIATAVVSIISPFLSAFMRGLTDSAESAGEEAGGKLRELASGLWKRLRSQVEEHPAAKEAAEDLAQDPDNEESAAALRIQIRKMLEADGTLSRDVEASLAEGQQAGIIGDVTTYGDVTADRGGVAVGRDVHGGIQTGGIRPNDKDDVERE